MLQPLQHALITLAHARGAIRATRDTRRDASAPSCLDPANPCECMHRKGEDEAARVVREMESDGIASDDGQVNCKNRYGVVTRDIHPVYIGRARITPWGGSAHHARKKPPRTCVRMCVYIRRTPTYVEESEACEAPSLPPTHRRRRLVAKSTVSLDTPP